jgi:hypothetical protein
MFILEYRESRQSDWGPFCEGVTLTEEEVMEFEGSLERSEGGLYRARLLPQYGYRVLVLASQASQASQAAEAETDPPLARNMPEQIHTLNDRVLTSLGL